MELNLVEKVMALEGVNLFAGLDPENVASIAMIAVEAEYQPGGVIIEEAKPVNALHVVLDGSVELTHKGRVIQQMSRGEVLGLWALFDEEDPIELTVKALEEARLLRIGRDEFYDLLADDSEFTSAIVSYLVKRLRKFADI
jgi:signal-transduction protein with cAMP-binding, CBS, and nucleotidyltransferase domain